MQYAASPGVSDLFSLWEEGKVGFSFLCYNTRFVCLFYACWLTKNGSKQIFFGFFLFCWEKHCPMRASCGMPGCVTTYDCLPSCARAKGSVCSSAPLPWEQTMGVLLPLWKPTIDCTWAGWISEVPKGISCNDSLSSGLITTSLQKRGL